MIIFGAIVVIICMGLLLTNLPVLGASDLPTILMAIAVIGTINILGLAVVISKVYEIAAKIDKKALSEQPCKCQKVSGEEE